ncbi:unnamed protein product [Brassicogethes aeneus]|uniref:Gamma-interferon-inducible lysosomal thiol reductase n=1 Tax=Brassicogethes aeneus TaxID=1431903 RepID=A0A9P0FEU2_BRAAE|nr:unnamed protein product [Brassicogethes aeneus]
MIHLKVLIFLCFFVLTLQDTVKVTLYYESLCPYSKEFITEQLAPAYSVLGDSLDIELIPFGKAKISNNKGKRKMICQHGPKECFGNKMQACVIDQNFTQKQEIALVNCIMDNDPEVKENVQACCKKYDIPWRPIKRCIKGDRGDRLLNEFGSITDKLEPKLTHVPTITINNVYNTTIDEDSRSSLLKTVCNFFVEKPTGC